MAEHDLKDVSGGDVVLGPGDHGGKVGFSDGRAEGRDVGLDWRGQGGERRAEVGFKAVESGNGGCKGGSGVETAVRIAGRDQYNLVADGVEDGDEGRAGQDGVRQVKGIGIGCAQGLQQPDHVIAEYPEQAGGHGREACGQFEPRGRHQGAQGGQGIRKLRLEPFRGNVRAARHLRHAAAAAPDQVRLAGDDGIAAVDGTALDRFQQEGMDTAVPDLQEGRNRGLKVVHQPADNDLWLAV